ncbi:MAG: H-NS histone family protein [Pseudomonadota bacterium]
MALPKIDKLSLDELKALQKQVAKAIDEFEENRRKEALAAVEAKAKEFGFSLADLSGKPKAKANSPKAKYRHPENPTLTWSGRGRQPVWIKEGLDAGKSLDDYAIK